MTNFFNELANRPACTLSAAEQFAFNTYCDAHRDELISALREQHPKTDLSFLTADKPQNENTRPQDKRYVFGLRGLAQLLNCSVPTAARFKASGILAKATHQVGRKIVFDVDKVLELANKRGGIHV